MTGALPRASRGRVAGWLRRAKGVCRIPRRRRAHWIAAALFLLGGVPAAAQQQGRCQVADPPFQATSANRMTGKELREWLPGKRIVAERQGAQRVNRYSFLFRSDGSVLFSCVSANGRPCVRYNSDSPAARDIGVWKLEGDVLVLTRTQFSQDGRSEGRVTFHRDGGRIAAARGGGPHLCLPGLLIIEQGGS